MTNWDLVTPYEQHGLGSGGLITFFIQVCGHDQLQALNAVNQVRRIYPDSKIIICSENSPNEFPGKWPGLFFDGGRVFGWEHGGEVIHQMLSIWARDPTDYLIKIDWDTYVRDRIFLPNPKIPMLFGSPNGGAQACSIQGGCIGITRAAAKRILDSKLALSKSLVTLAGVAPRFAQPLLRRRKVCGLSSYDHVLGWIADQLRLPLIKHPQIRSSLEFDPTSDGAHIIHPFLFREEANNSLLPKMVCINLPRAKKRKKSFKELWIKTLKYPIKFVNGVDRRDYEDGLELVWSNGRITKFDDPGSNGRTGDTCCCRSHWEVLRAYLDNGPDDKGIIIFEDDAIQGPSAHRIGEELQAARDEMPFLDIINISRHYPIRKAVEISRHGKHVNQLHAAPWGTEAIWYSPKGAEIMLAHFEEFNAIADSYDEITRQGIVGILTHPAATHKPGGSSYIQENNPYRQFEA